MTSSRIGTTPAGDGPSMTRCACSWISVISFPAPRQRRGRPEFPSLLHLHLVGNNLGVFDVIWDDASGEPLWAGQLRTKDDLGFLDVWTSFAPNAAATTAQQARDDLAITAYRIRASVQPPTELQAVTEADIQVRRGGQRAVLFELSRYLKVDDVNYDGHALDFIQNPALEGSQLARRGNDLIAVVFPAELAGGQALKLHFHYAGDVLSDAGSGLLYVGARGTWYPSLGLVPASFDMEFRYPVAVDAVSDWKTNRSAGGQTGTGAARFRRADCSLAFRAPNACRWIQPGEVPARGGKGRQCSG